MLTSVACAGLLEIENLFVFERAVAVKRVGNVIEAIERYCLEGSEIIGIGFCLTKKHAEFMSEIFNKSGIPSEFLIAESEDGVRDSVKRRLVTKEIKFVFVVDIYNEGIDIPEGTLASPFTCLGLADFQSHYGSAPISIVWKMKEPLPGFVMKKTVKV